MLQNRTCLSKQGCTVVSTWRPGWAIIIKQVYIFYIYIHIYTYIYIYIYGSFHSWLIYIFYWDWDNKLHSNNPVTCLLHFDIDIQAHTHIYIYIYNIYIYIFTFKGYGSGRFILIQLTTYAKPATKVILFRLFGAKSLPHHRLIKCLSIVYVQ